MSFRAGITPVMGPSPCKYIFGVEILSSTIVGKMAVRDDLQTSIGQHRQFLGLNSKAVIPCQGDGLAFSVGFRLTPITLFGMTSAPYVSNDFMVIKPNPNAGDAAGVDILVGPISEQSCGTLWSIEGWE